MGNASQRAEVRSRLIVTCCILLCSWILLIISDFGALAAGSLEIKRAMVMQMRFQYADVNLPL